MRYYFQFQALTAVAVSINHAEMTRQIGMQIVAVKTHDCPFYSFQQACNLTLRPIKVKIKAIRGVSDDIYNR